MAFSDFLARVLNPNGVWDYGGIENRNRLAEAGIVPHDAYGRPMYDAPLPVGQAPNGPAMSAPQQEAPVQVTQASQPRRASDSGGGGFGGFLGNLFQDPQAKARNHTVSWLRRQGLDEGTATLMAGNKQVLQQYLLRRSQGASPIEINGRLVDPNTYEVLADFSDKKEPNRSTTTINGKLVDTNTGAVIGNYKDDGEDKPDFSAIAGVRKEIQSLPSYKNFAQAAPIFDTMLDASSRDTKAADLNLIYGLGKIFDPNSVVREGEMVLVKDTASLPDWVIGTIQSVNGGARLQPETRAAIMQEARSRVDAYKSSLDSDFQQYQGIAERYGINPADLLPVLPKIKDLPKTGDSRQGAGLPLPPLPAAPSAPGAAPQVAPQPAPPSHPVAPDNGVIDYRDWLAPGRKR